MKSFVKQAQFYSTYHQKKATLYTHWIGVPLILFSMMILLGFVHISIPGLLSTNLAFLVTLGFLFYYYKLQWQLALVLTPILALLLWLASCFTHWGPTKTSLWVFLITFLVGWGLQFYGHYLEGKKPAFMENLWLAFIAPLYLIAELFFIAGYMQGLKKSIDKEHH